MGKTRHLFKKIRDPKGIFHAKMGTIKDRNMDLQEEEILKRGVSSLLYSFVYFCTELYKRIVEYTELYKKDLNELDNHNGVSLT